MSDQTRGTPLDPIGVLVDALNDHTRFGPRVGENRDRRAAPPLAGLRVLGDGEADPAAVWLEEEVDMLLDAFALNGPALVALDAELTARRAQFIRNGWTATEQPREDVS